MPVRVPLPVKLLLSYLLVVAAGALPTFVYLRAEMATQLLGNAAADLAREVNVMARALVGLPDAERRERCRFFSSLAGTRVSLIAESGEVLFDTHVANPLVLASHANRPEIRTAFGHQTPKPTYDPGLDGVGVSRRVSATTGVDSLYAAARIPDEKGPSRVLRLALPMERTERLFGDSVSVLRNAQAAAVSIALGLSLLAAVLFVRPLRRIKETAEALASGDYARHVGPLADDEVGDVGRALEQLGAELRRRMAIAGSGEALLVQLVDAVPTPLVVFEHDGEVVALNGAARRLLKVEDPSAGRRLRELLEDVAFQDALSRAEDESEAMPIELDVDGAGVSGFVHVLKRPGTAPLSVLFVPPKNGNGECLIPVPGSVRARPLADVLEEARGSALPSLRESGIDLDAPAQIPEVVVADVEGRLPQAVSRALLGCAPWFGGRPGTLSLDVEVEDTRVAVALDAAPSSEALQDIRPLLEPLGGGVDVTQGEVTLWLPRA